MIQLGTGDIAVGTCGDVIASGPLGSCIAVILFERDGMRAGMAHIMLPGRCPAVGAPQENRYAQSAIDNLLALLGARAMASARLGAVILGAGNVLKRPDDTTCSANICSVVSYLGEIGIPILREELGGQQRRSVTLDLARGEIRRSIEDERECVFHVFTPKENR